MFWFPLDMWLAVVEKDSCTQNYPHPFKPLLDFISVQDPNWSTSTSVVVVGCGLWICLLLLLFLPAYLYCLFRKKRRHSNDPLPPTPLQLKDKKEKEKKKKEKIKNEREDKRAAHMAADGLLSVYEDTSLPYNKDDALPDMGSRMHKYWYRVTSQDTYNCHILTIRKLSKDFTCSREVESYINEHLRNLKHCNLQTVNEIKFTSTKGKEQVAIVEPFWEKGSLRDYIYKEPSPTRDWSEKYKVSTNLPEEKVALFGEQILEAVLYLYGRGLKPVGHIHTGNIYMKDEDTCLLGGFESMLLQDKSRLHRTCEKQKCLEDIDIIMFGHVIYEMSTGVGLKHLVPLDYQHIKSDNCRNTIHYIFARRSDGRFKHSLKKVRELQFFGGNGPGDSEPETEGKTKSELRHRTKKPI